MSEPAEPTQCPICGAGNECGMAAGAAECWCFTATIPASVLEQIPEAARGVACVCRECAAGDKKRQRALPVQS
jgi:hypothetical protein